MGNQQAGCSGLRGREGDTERKGLHGFDGKYHPLRVLGSGQFSTVYECVRVDNPRERYAMKVMSCWTWDSRTLRRIEEEISIMQELGQSHTCLCHGLAFLHERGIIHRDIKPENILIAKDDGSTLDIKISDFGLAKKIFVWLRRLLLFGDDHVVPADNRAEAKYSPVVTGVNGVSGSLEISSGLASSSARKASELAGSLQ
ncbi:putative ULK kinase [Neospora caninum Liverpool]|uniref:Putative ULK kinase n=1 Tax=Neospora caninum (strain Liverpool) TaxID=572307 RepID=F0VDU8_NEOCL|nr:putative ULK kinase [Neospora caninum Liverpool]CBZ51891.1 putative ULK kinase [Neospora caninum Liverpool]|eukprot:XP_003881924.1 putative ULK kinase [Neospora caninum Liverpool]